MCNGVEEHKRKEAELAQVFILNLRKKSETEDVYFPAIPPVPCASRPDRARQQETPTPTSVQPRVLNEKTVDQNAATRDEFHIQASNRTRPHESDPESPPIYLSKQSKAEVPSAQTPLPSRRHHDDPSRRKKKFHHAPFDDDGARETRTQPTKGARPYE